jgi:hypothetical protein
VVGSVITDDTGGFVFDGLPPGAYTLIATGYPPVAAEVTVSMGTPTETVVTLWPSTPDAPAPKSVTSALEPLQPVMASNGALKN